MGKNIIINKLNKTGFSQIKKGNPGDVAYITKEELSKANGIDIALFFKTIQDRKMSFKYNEGGLKPVAKKGKWVLDSINALGSLSGNKVYSYSLDVEGEIIPLNSGVVKRVSQVKGNQVNVTSPFLLIPSTFIHGDHSYLIEMNDGTEITSVLKWRGPKEGDLK